MKRRRKRGWTKVVKKKKFQVVLVVCTVSHTVQKCTVWDMHGTHACPTKVLLLNNATIKKCKR